jgi:uncharacterized protein YbjT (DUF2867 family)
MKGKILLTGASGYIGGVLLDRLMERGAHVRCMVRQSALFPERERVEVVEGDAREEAALERALENIDTAFYLIHSLGTSLSKFEAQDRAAAELFARIAEKKGVRRIIYLSGLGNEGEALSPHLRSRQEVGEILRRSKVDVIEFRASIILGPGSASYEIVRALVRKLPVMVAPRWVKSRCQPIYVGDVLAYLMGALESEDLGTQIIEIGGPDPVRYVDLLEMYARGIGSKLRILILPILTPWLSSLWLGLVTPVYARIGRALIEGLKNDTVVHNPKAKTLFPMIEPLGLEAAVKQCIAEEEAPLKRSWMGAISAKGYSLKRQLEGKRVRTFEWEGSIEVERSASGVFHQITQRPCIKDSVYARWLWRVRGFIDVTAGGVGLRDTGLGDELHVADIVDWWRVESIEPNKSITLLAEMRMPGIARFILSVESLGGRARLHLKAKFDAAGVWGKLYWWSTYPFHLILFPRTLKKFKAYIERAEPPQ